MHEVRFIVRSACGLENKMIRRRISPCGVCAVFLAKLLILTINLQNAKIKFKFRIILKISEFGV